MKFISLFLLMTTFATAAPQTAKKLQSNSKEVMNKQTDTKNKEPNALDKKAADCDEKAKKPVDITPETISLSGNTGCSLDEAEAKP